MSSSKKVFLTGGTGLIGKELLLPLTKAGFEVYALTLDGRSPSVAGVNWIKGNLFDEVLLERIFKQIQPQYLLNMAWVVTGDYQAANVNFDFVRAGLSLLKHFAANGGKRAVFAGTCFEYAAKNAPIKETDPVSPLNIYAYCKHALHGLPERFCDNNGVSFGYGRIFYVYGRNEHAKRLTASIINSLKAGQTVQVNHSQLARDYMYTRDIAAAFVKFLDGDVRGSVNICTGEAITLADYARTISSLMEKDNLLVLKEEPTSQPLMIVGNTSRLREEVGFEAKYTLADALKEIIKESDK